MSEESRSAEPPKSTPELRPLSALHGQLNAWMDEVTRPCGFLFVDAPPAVDLRPTLRAWLDELAEDGELIVELTVGADGEDRPEALRERLAAAVEALFPDFADPRAPLHGRLPELLARLSKRHLAPPSRTLLLVIHDLDELHPRDPDDNPLPRLLPHVLPRGVFVIATAHPPTSASPWLAALGDRETISIAAQDEHTQHEREHTQHEREHTQDEHAQDENTQDENAQDEHAQDEHAQDREHNISVAEVGQLLLRATSSAPVVDALLTAERASDELRRPLAAALAVLYATAEPLSPEVFPLLLAGVVDERDSAALLRLLTPLLRPETATEIALLPGVRPALRRILGEPLRMAAQRHLLKVLPSLGAAYSGRHRLRHTIGSADWPAASDLVSDLVSDPSALMATITADGLGHIVADLDEAATLDPDPARGGRLTALRSSLIAAYPALRADPQALPALLWGELADRGLTDAALRELFADRRPALRRRLPRHHREGATTLLEGHAGAVTDLALSPDEQLLASASVDTTVKLWRVTSGREQLSLCGHSGAVNACTFTPEGHLLTASDDGLLLLWDPRSGAELGRYSGHDGGIEGLAISRDGGTLVSLGADGLLIAWTCEGADIRERARAWSHELGGTAIALSPDGHIVATGSHDKSVKLWTTAELGLTRTLSGPEYAVSDLSFDPAGGSIAASSYDNRVWVWSLADGAVQHEFIGHGSWVTSCSFLDDGRLLSSSRDRSLRLWDLSANGEHHELRGHTKMVNVALGDRGATILHSAGKDHTIRRWRLSSSGSADQELARPEAADAHEGAIRACLIAREFLYSAGADGTLRRWDRRSGAARGVYTGHEHAVLGATLDATGETLISAGSDRTIRIWDAARQLQTRALVGHQKWVSDGALSPDGAHLASASHDATLKIWELASGQELRTLSGHRGEVHSCLYAPSGRLLSAGADGMIRAWDPGDGRELMTLAGHEGAVRALATSPDGKRLLSAGDDGTVRLWSLRRGRERTTLRGHEGAVVGVGFVDDDHIVSVGVDRSLRLWSLKDERCLSTLSGGHPFAALAVAPVTDENDDAVADLLAGDEAGDLWLVAVDLNAAQGR